MILQDKMERRLDLHNKTVGGRRYPEKIIEFISLENNRRYDVFHYSIVTVYLFNDMV